MKIFSISIMLFILFSGILFSGEEKSLVNTGKRTLKELVKQRNELVNQGKYDEAIRIDYEIINIYPGTKEAKGALVDIAFNYYRKKEYENAINFSKNILEKSSEIGELYTILQYIIIPSYRMLNKFEKCNEAIKQFIEKYPEFRKELLMEIADNYRYEKKYSEMVDVYLEVMKVFPKDEKIAIAKEIIERMSFVPREMIKNQGVTEKIISLYEYMAENVSQYSDKCFYQISILHTDLDKYDEAIKALDKAIENSKDKNFIIRMELEKGRLYKKIGKQKKTEEILEKIVSSSSLEEIPPELLVLIAMNYRELEKFEKEIEVLKKVVEKVPQTRIGKNAQYRIASIYAHELGNFGKGIEEYEKFISLYPDDPMTIFCMRHIGKIFLDQNEFEKALEVQERILKTNPDDLSSKVMIKLINDYYKKGQVPTQKDIEKVTAEIKRSNKIEKE